MTEEVVANNKSDSNDNDTKDDTMEQPFVWEIFENCWLLGKVTLKIKWRFINIYLKNNDDSENMDEKNNEMEEEKNDVEKRP